MREGVGKKRTEGVWHAARVAVGFDEVAAFDVGLEVEVRDYGARLGGFAVEGGFAWWIGCCEGWEGGVDCGCHFCGGGVRFLYLVV